MTANSTTNQDPSAHIGTAPHGIRNLLIVSSLIVMAGLLALYYWHSGREDNAAAKELAQFRQAMFTRCGGEQFTGKNDPKLEEIYADSSRMREVVVNQTQSLRGAGIDCDAVVKALRGADYPIR